MKTSVETDLSVAPFEMASTEGGVELARALLPKCASKQDYECRTIVSGVYPAAIEMKAVSMKHSYSKHSSEHFTPTQVKKVRNTFCALVIGTFFTHMRSEANRPERIANLQNTKVASAKKQNWKRGHFVVSTTFQFQ